MLVEVWLRVRRVLLRVPGSSLKMGNTLGSKVISQYLLADGIGKSIEGKTIQKLTRASNIELKNRLHS